MTNFIRDNTSLGSEKVNFRVRTDVPATQKISDTDWNTFRQALLDVQGWVRGGDWLGLAAQAVAPTPVGVDNFLWIDQNGLVHLSRAGIDGVACLAPATSSPDGVLTAPKGTLATDATTGVVWRNRSGSTRWDPISIPPEWGSTWFDDMVGTSMTLGNNIGGGSQADTATEAGRVGIRRHTATAAGVDGATTRVGVSAVVVGGGAIVIRGSARIATLSDGVDNLVARIGAGDVQSTFADHTDGIYLENDRNTNGNNNWYLCTGSNGAHTKVNTGIPALASAWQHFEIRVNAAGTEVTAEIDGVAASTPVTTNIPTGAGRVFSPIHAMIAKSLGSGARIFDVDWMSFWQVFSTARSL